MRSGSSAHSCFNPAELALGGATGAVELPSPLGLALVLGASQFFAGAFLATDPPPRRLLRSELGLWNAGTLLLAVAVPGGSAALSGVAAALLALALGA